MKSRGLLPLCLAVLVAAITPRPSAAQQRFDHPQVSGVAIDWCLGWSEDCGKPAADRFCHDQGSPEATSFAIAEDVGHTVVQSTGQPCDDPGCDGFAFVECRAAARSPASRMPSAGGGLRTVVPPQEILVFDEVDGKPTLYYAMEGNNAIGSTYLGFTWERNSYFPTAEDFDGDGLEEQLRWSPNETSFGMVGFDAAGNVVYAPFVVNLVSQDPAFQTGDFNGDGRADILALDRHGGISGNEIRKELRTLQLNDDGTVQKFRIISDFPLDGEGYDLGYTHDLNLDGRDELVFEAEGMLVSFQFSDSLDSFNGTTLTNLESDSRLSFGDFDGDDLGEIVIVQRATGALAMLHLDAAGRVADRVELAPPTGPVAIYRYPLDWDGDGRDDLEMIRNPDAANPTFEIQRFDGQGLFAGPAVVVANLPGIPRSGVFTNDGRPSLLFAEPGAALRLILLRPDLQIDRTLSSENVLPGEIQVLTGDYTRD